MNLSLCKISRMFSVSWNMEHYGPHAKGSEVWLTDSVSFVFPSGLRPGGWEGITQKHRDYPTLHSKNKKRNRIRKVSKGLFSKAMIY